MFNHTLKKEATQIHEKSITRYNDSYQAMEESCSSLLGTRKSSVSIINDVQSTINTISNRPKCFDTDFGEIGREIDNFKSLEEFAKQEFEAAVKAGVGTLGGSAAGASIAALGPNALLRIATAFGKATTGRAIRTLSGHAAKKAAVGWIGRTLGGFAVKSGSGYVVGKTILALCGPIGWGVSAASAGGAVISLTKNNRKISNELIDEAKEIESAREAVDECNASIQALEQQTKLILEGLHKDIKGLKIYEYANYSELNDDDKYFLGSIVNNTLTLAKLLNKTIT